MEVGGWGRGRGKSVRGGEKEDKRTGVVVCVLCVGVWVLWVPWVSVDPRRGSWGSWQ